MVNFSVAKSALALVVLVACLGLMGDAEADVDVEMIREVCSSNSELPIAARVLSRIQASKPNQINKIININDSVINRSNLNFEGEENIEDSVINRNNKV